MPRLGILGGTFNPIHFGHLLMAERAREALNLEKVIFIPSGNPPHKDNKIIIPAQERLDMVKLAIDENKSFCISNIEIEREGKTYTVDTLKELRNIYGFETELFFIIGADVVMDLPKWKSAREALKLCSFAAMGRPGFKSDIFAKQIEYLKEEYDATIESIEFPLIEISSSDIRERLASGLSIKYLLPEKVFDYIFKEGIYL